MVAWLLYLLSLQCCVNGVAGVIVRRCDRDYGADSSRQPTAMRWMDGVRSVAVEGGAEVVVW